MTNQTSIRAARPKRGRFAPLVAALALIAPLAVAAPAVAQHVLVTPSDADAARSDTAFGSHFMAVIDPLGPEHDGLDLMLPEHAIDLDAFEPPIEETDVARDLGTGVASYYGQRFHGRRTASGERFDMGAMTAAHRTLPFGSMVRITNPRTGSEVTVRINDRGPFSGKRVIDLSRAAASRIGLVTRGHGKVKLELLES